MTAGKISLACRNYDRTQAILRGLVKIPGIEIELHEMTSVPRMFAGFFRGEFDVSEFSLAELIYAVSRGHREFCAIPVFPSRVFRHGFIFCNAALGIRDRKSSDGTRIGFPRLVQTASIWIRSALLDELGTSPDQLDWYVASVHHWDGDGGGSKIVARDGSVIHCLDNAGGDENETMELALTDGRIDILGTTQIPKSFGRNPRVTRFFENYCDVEKNYFKRTGIFPIMHVLVARTAVVDRYPDLPVKLFDLFSKAKRWAHDWIGMDPSLGLAWKNRYITEEREFFQGDPWVYGLKENLPALTRFLAYCYDLGISDRILEPQDLFYPSTLHLVEEQ